MIKLHSKHSSWWKRVEDVLKTCWRRLQHNSFSSSKMSCRRFQYVLEDKKMVRFMMVKTENRLGILFPAWKVSKYRVFSGAYSWVKRKMQNNKNFLLGHFSRNDFVFFIIYITITLTSKHFIYIRMTHCTKN